MTTLLVIAKSPQPGRSKTRLCPPCTHNEAAALAEAAIVDTLAAVRATAVDRRIVVLDGDPGPWLPDDIDVVAQSVGPFADRLTRAFTDTALQPSEPMLLIGMDTPQVTPELLAESLAVLDAHDAVLGLAADGGWWAVGLHQVTGREFAGIEMSTADTGRNQLTRLRSLGHDVGMLPTLTDVDTFADARAVADGWPTTTFAAAVHAFVRERPNQEAS